MIKPDLVCPAGTPAALRDAVDAGADCVYCGFQNATNARNFPGLNFTPDELDRGIAYALWAVGTAKRGSQPAQPWNATAACSGTCHAVAPGPPVAPMPT